MNPEDRRADRRMDGTTRDRVDELASSWNAAVELLDHRYKRVAALSLGGIVITIICVVLGFMLVQGQRWAQSEDACNRTNQQTDATIGLLRDLKVRPAVIELAAHRYPHVPPLNPSKNYAGPMTCRDFADQRVSGPKL